MSTEDFEQAYKDNSNRLQRLWAIDESMSDDTFHCIDANENVMRLNYEKLQAELATLQSALDEQSQALALARQNADAEMELFKRDEATIRELQERNARLLDMVNTKEAEKVELRKTIAQRDELLRTRDATLARYKGAMEEALRISHRNITDEHGNIKLGLTGLALIDMRYPLIDALQETETAAAPQESYPDFEKGQSIPYELAELPEGSINKIIVGKVLLVTKMITKQGEIIARFFLAGEQIVVLPRNWHLYEKFILGAKEKGLAIRISATPQASERGGMEYILSAIDTQYSSTPEAKSE